MFGSSGTGHLRWSFAVHQFGKSDAGDYLREDRPKMVGDLEVLFSHNDSECAPTLLSEVYAEHTICYQVSR